MLIPRSCCYWHRLATHHLLGNLDCYYIPRVYSHPRFAHLYSHVPIPNISQLVQSIQNIYGFIYEYARGKWNNDDDWLKTFFHACGYGSKRGIDLAWWTTENKATNGVASHLDVLEGAENMNFTMNADMSIYGYSCILSSTNTNTYVSASTMRVLLAFSIVNLVLPSRPAIRPIALAKWSPWSVLTSLISNESKYISSKRNNAIASCTSKPNANART